MNAIINVTSNNGIIPFQQARLRFWDIAGKVVRAAVIAIAALVGNVLTLGIPLAYRLISDARKAPRKEEVEMKMIQHLCSFDLPKAKLVEEIKGHSVGSEDAEYFASCVLHLNSQILNLKSKREVTVGSAASLHDEFKELAKEKRFIDIFNILEKQKSSSAKFLKNLAMTFYSTNVQSIVETHGKRKFKDIQPDMEKGYSIAQVGRALKKNREKGGFRKDTWYKAALWMITHPIQAYHSWESHARPDLYDSGKSNPTYMVEEIKMKDGGVIRVIAGPTPYNDPVHRHIWLRDCHELRFNNMDWSHTNEKHMVAAMQNVARLSDGHLKHVVLGFDAEEKKESLDQIELGALIDTYKKNLLKRATKGVVIPVDLLNSDEIGKACDAAKSLVKELKPDLTKKESRQAVLVIVDTMMALAILMKQQKLHKELHLSTACKQCFDRGPVYLLALRLFLRSFTTDQPLSKKEFYEIAGFPLFRAPLNEGRKQVNDKAIVFEELTQILGSHFDLLSKHTRLFLKDFGFEPPAEEKNDGNDRTI